MTRARSAHRVACSVCGTTCTDNQQVIVSARWQHRPAVCSTFCAEQRRHQQAKENQHAE